MPQDLVEVLGRENTPGAALAVLREVVGFSDQELSRALQVSDRSIKRWRDGEAMSTESREQLFDFVRAVMRLANRKIPPGNIHAWFFYRNAFLDERRPIDVFASDGYPALEPAFSAVENSIYA